MSALASAIKRAIAEAAVGGDEGLRLAEVTDVSPLEVELLDTNLTLDEALLEYGAWASTYMALTTIAVGDVCVLAHKSDDADGTWVVVDFLEDDVANALGSIRNRANHTGTQLASTISNFDTQVRTSRLDQMAAPTASVGLNSQKITSLATPTSGTDAVNKAYADAQHLSGTLAARPAAASGNAGCFYMATDSVALFFSTGSAWVRVSVPAGTAMPYSGSTLPDGYVWAFGQTISRSGANADLFAAVSTTYGAGDGSTTFGVPDYRGRIPVGLDNMGGSDAGRLSMSNTLGGTGGEETHLLTSNESGLPAHNHTASHNIPAQVWYETAGGRGGTAGNATFATLFITVNNNTAANAASAHNNLQPYILQNWIVKL